MGFKIKKTVNGETVWQPIKAKKYTTSKITEYTGSLPIAINADGDVLIDYRIYGADGGVGEPTENLFDINDSLENYTININTGKPIQFIYSKYVLSDYIPIALSTVTISAKCTSIGSSGAHWATYDKNKTFISGGIAFYSGSLELKRKVVDTSGAAFIRVDYALEQLTDCMLTPGSTAPTSYIPYGYKLPMVTRSENLFDPAKSEMNCYYDTSGEKRNTNFHNTSDYIPVESGKTYTLSLTRVATGFGVYLNLWDDGKQFVTNLLSLVSPDGSYSFSSPINGYIRFNWVPNYTHNVMLTKGSTAPTSYIPYSRTDIPVYIGENQLEENEYVSFSEQKIYRDVSGTLTPTDPPVPLPEIPTIKGETVIDYDGEPKPSQMYIKYKSWSGWSDIDNYKMVNGNWTQEVT